MEIYQNKHPENIICKPQIPKLIVISNEYDLIHGNLITQWNSFKKIQNLTTRMGF